MSDETKRAFMDGIDWQEHVEHDAKGTILFPSEAAARSGKRCIARGGKCGIVEVEIRLIRWVEDQDLSSEFGDHPDMSDEVKIRPSGSRDYYCGEPIDEMTREELIEAVKLLGSAYRALLDTHMRDLRNLFE